MTHPLMQAFEGKLNDEFLYDIVDLRLPPEEQKVVTVLGSHVEGFINDGHYHVVLKGENETSRKALRAKDLEAVKAAFGEVALPKPATVIMDEQAAEIAALKAQLAEKKGGK